MKELIKNFLNSIRTIKLGISLIVVPVYFYLVDFYQPQLVEWLIRIQKNYSWGKLGLLTSTMGVVLLFSYFHDEKLMHIKYGEIFSVFALFFATHIFWYLDVNFAYFGVIFFIPLVYNLVSVVFKLSVVIKDFLISLESNLQLALIIPILTVILNYFFGK